MSSSTAGRNAPELGTTSASSSPTVSLGNGSSILEDGDVTLVKLLQAFSTYYTELFIQIPSQMRLCLFGNALIQGCIQVELMNVSVYYSGGIKGTLLVQSVTMVTFASRQ